MHAHGPPQDSLGAGGVTSPTAGKLQPQRPNRKASVRSMTKRFQIARNHGANSIRAWKLAAGEEAQTPGDPDGHRVAHMPIESIVIAKQGTHWHGEPDHLRRCGGADGNTVLRG